MQRSACTAQLSTWWRSRLPPRADAANLAALIAESLVDPPVPINKTIRPDYIVSLEDGLPNPSLVRRAAQYGGPCRRQISLVHPMPAASVAGRWDETPLMRIRDCLSLTSSGF